MAPSLALKQLQAFSEIEASFKLFGRNVIAWDLGAEWVSAE
jgi:hypothetical protein